MADKMTSAEAGFRDTKTRTIFILVVVILLFAVAIGYFSLRKAVQTPGQQASTLTQTPAIQSVPGVGNPSRQYVKLQQQQNQQLAQQALKTGGSAVPTLTRSTYLGNGNFNLQSPAGSTTNSGCSVEELQRARAAGVTAFELRCRGCDAAALKAAGYTAGELKDAGFTAAQLKSAGYTPEQLRDAGFSNKELQAAGVPVAMPTGKVDCSAANLAKAHSQGVDAKQFISCGAAALKAAGYSAQQLKNAGFTAGQLHDAGFSVGDLQRAGFTPSQLRDAGINAGALRGAGFNAAQLKQAGYTDGDLIRAGFSPQEVMPAVKVVVPTTTTTTPLSSKTPTRQPISSQPMSSQDDVATMLAKIRAQQAKDVSKQDWEDKRNALQQDMTAQAGDLFSSWIPLPRQQFVVGKKPTNAANQSASGSQNGQTNGDQAADMNTFKAGSVFFAVLDTGINSDEKSPILATIVAGPLKGAKLLGSFVRENNRVVVRFDRLSVPHMNNSISLNAYAIDPNSARTAMASSVDNHYLLRYGSLFASAFAEGLGQAVQNSGQTTVISDLTVKQVWKDLNTTEKALVAMGNVGEKFGQAMAKYFNTPPTVRVSAGSGLGVLLMSDLKVPKQK